MVEVQGEVNTVVAVRASVDEAFALVADVRRSGLHFPGVASLEPAGPNGRWAWRMEEKGLGPINFKVSYDAVYVADPVARTVRWAPPDKGAGDMESYGQWTVEPRPSGEGATLRFEARTVAYVPAPRLMSRMVEAVAREELGKLKRAYVAAIQQTLGGSP